MLSLTKQEASPQTENIAIYRGDDCPIDIEVTNEDGTAFDLTDCRVDLHACLKPNTEPVLKLSTETGDILVQGNKMQVLVAHQFTQSQQWGQASYDLQLIDKNGMVKTLLRGVITLTGDVTQVETAEHQADRVNAVATEN